MDEDYMGSVAMVVGDVVATELEDHVVKALQHVRTQLCNVLSTTPVVYESLLAKLPVLPPELKDAVMANLTAEYNGRLSCLLARIVAQTARQRGESDVSFVRHLCSHLEMTDATGLPFAVMDFNEKDMLKDAAVGVTRLVIVPIVGVPPAAEQDDRLHRAAKKHSSEN